MRPEDLIGTWSLESFTAKGSNGVEGFPLGESPQGLLTYTASGHMAAVLMSSGRPKFASGDLRGGTPEEIKPSRGLMPMPAPMNSMKRAELSLTMLKFPVFQTGKARAKFATQSWMVANFI